MATVETLSANDNNHGSSGLLGAAIVVLALIAAIGLVVYVVATPPAPTAPRGPLVTDHGRAPSPQVAAGWKAPALMPTAGATARRACLEAIDRAAASRRLASQAAIAASTDMLRKCNAR